MKCVFCFVLMNIEKMKPDDRQYSNCAFFNSILVKIVIFLVNVFPFHGSHLFRLCFQYQFLQEDYGVFLIRPIFVRRSVITNPKSFSDIRNDIRNVISNISTWESEKNFWTSVNSCSKIRKGSLWNLYQLSDISFGYVEDSSDVLYNDSPIKLSYFCKLSDL